MNQFQDILKKHPESVWTDIENISRLVQISSDCASACVACADACLGEESVRDLVRCIRLNADCADVCTTTSRMLSRLTGADLRLIHAQLDACIAACQVCGTECDMHGRKYEYCRICADICRLCADECKNMLRTVQAVVG